MNNKAKIILLTFLSCFSVLCSYSQGPLTPFIDVEYAAADHPGRFRVLGIKNNYPKPVVIYIINEYKRLTSEQISLKFGETYNGDVTCNIVRASTENDRSFDTVLRHLDKESKKERTKWTSTKVVPVKSDATLAPAKTAPSKKSVSADSVLMSFPLFLDSIPLLSLAMEEDSALFVSSRDSLFEAFLSRYDSYEIDKDECVKKMHVLFAQRIDSCRSHLKVIEKGKVIPKGKRNYHINWRMVTMAITCAAIVILIIALLFWYRKASRKYNRLKSSKTTAPSLSTGDPSIVVMGDSKPIELKRQNIDDVVNNDAYLRIDCHEFCADSAVRTMYVKNSCIKDIYNMYADDLRDPAKMNEDGCMVIGRWVLDEATEQYDITLEEIVLPGSDAVFSEQELNFGGKIKLKLSDRLRRLRRDTDLQYELTCWVHSHPGLKVFFSRSDYNLHLQHSRPSCPKALTAFVIDILTPEQELGIFTYKQTGEVNSKADLTKMYSLEQMYKWAVESERRTIKPEDYYDSLGEAAKHRNECYGVELSNGAVIDMSLLSVEQRTGFVATVYGFTIEKDGRYMFIANRVSSDVSITDDEAIGCFVIAAHCSIPSIRRTVTDKLGKIRFVMVYTASDGLLTTIPVIDQELCGDEAFFGEQKLEDLKIWTKRRR